MDQSGGFRGTAVLQPEAVDVLRYAENGEMRFGNGPVMTATRAYLWRFEQGQVVVNFADGSDFHRFVPYGASAGTDHPCGEDFYQVRYDFTCWPDWTAEWTVSGPRKDYTSVSRYTRAQ